MPVVGGQQKNQPPKGNIKAAALLLPFEIFGGSMNQERAFQILSYCAEKYNSELSNRNLLFVYGSPKQPKYFESTFLPRNFLHLTGIKFLKTSKPASSTFLSMLLDRKISSRDIMLDSKGIVNRKLIVLPQLMNIYNSAKMVGEYNYSKPLLCTDTLVGSVKSCMGFVVDNTGFFVPNTTLQIDLRNITKKPQQRVLAVFRKDLNCEKYEEVTYTANGVALENINFPEELKSKIALNPSIMFGKVVNSDSENIELNILPSEKTMNDKLPKKEENQSSDKAPVSFERRHIADIMKDAKEKADRINRENANNSQKNKGFDR